jgi:peptidoglycan/xylan/chitin deacetylase (PgdA/CDA1 family)
LNQLIPILLYHSIAHESSPRFRPWTVTPQRFAEHTAYLQAQHYTTLTVTQLVQTVHSGDRLPERPVVITFDDGFADFYTEALPILQQHRCVATLYVATAFVGRTSSWLQQAGEGARPMLTWSQLNELHTCGIECGAHSHTHPQLDVLPRAEAWTEIMHSKRALEQRLGQPIATFAYPYGYHSATTIQLVQQAGFTSACAVKHAISTIRDNRFALARMFVFADTHVANLAALLEGRATPVTWARERLSTKGWRIARRFMLLFAHLKQTRTRPPEA